MQRAAIRRQAGNFGRFQPPQGGPSRKIGKVWMFDNEIDWVMRHLGVSPYQVAARRTEGMPHKMARYKAEHKQ
jgi:hypothetical protein